MRDDTTTTLTRSRLGDGPSALALLVLLTSACSESARDRTLVVHSSMPTEVLAYAERIFETDFPTVDVRIVEAAPEETLAALRDGTGPIDVWWGAPGATLETAADEGRLQPYEPPWLGRPGVGRPDPAGRWQVSMISPLVIAFNREQVPLPEAPTDWIDLFHHAWAEEVVLVDPSVSSWMADFVSTMIVRALREDDDLLRGFDWLGRLDAATGDYVPDAAEAIRRLRTGEDLLTILPRHLVEQARHERAPWIHYRLPESGTPMLSRGIAVTVDAAQPDLARTFIDLAGTMEVGTVARLHTRWMPGHGDVDMSVLPDDFEIDMPWQPIPLAIDTIARQGPGWINRWDLEIRNRAGR